MEPLADGAPARDADGVRSAGAANQDATVVVLGFEGGGIELELGGTEPLVARRRDPGDRPSPAAPLPLLMNGESVYRITGDGRFEPLDARPTGASRSGEVIVRAVDANPDRDPSKEPRRSAIDVLHPDGSYTEIRAVDDRADNRLTLVETDGTRIPIEIGPDGRATLPDGVVVDLRTAEAITEPAGADPVGPQTGAGGSSTEQSWPAWARSVALGMVAIAAVGLLVVLVRRRRAVIDDQPFGPTFVSDAGVPDERFGEFTAMLLADPDPARAIRLAFSAAERGVGGLPRRITTETPFEWCDRVVGEQPQVIDPLQSLCQRFTQTRFAAVRPNATDRNAAVADLVDLRRLAAAPEARSAPRSPVGTGAGSDR